MFRLISLILFAAPISASAQLNFGVLNQTPSFAESFLKGQRDALEMQKLRQETERIRQETERMRLENEQRRRQIEESKKLIDNQTKQELARRASDEDTIKRWFAVAQPRIGLYPDFNRIVFAEDLRITVPMIKIMAESKYAADIAYFLGKNKEVASEIASMEMERMRINITGIESSIREKELKDAQEELQKLRDLLAQRGAPKGNE